MNNPIALTRELINQQLGTRPKENGPTPEEVAKEQERLRALHEGWLTHPVTVNFINDLQKCYGQKSDATCKHAIITPHIPNPHATEMAVLRKILVCIKAGLSYNDIE